jgi:hypothetical protein
VEASDPNADRKDKRPGSGISLQTLIIASFASAVASFAASRIWGAGTLISAAVTPVIVALVAELLRRPVQTVAATAKKGPTVHTLRAVRNRTIAATKDSPGVRSAATRVTTDSATRDEPQSYSGLPEPRVRVEAPAGIAPVVDPGTIKPAEVNTWRPHWRPVVVTGLLAFAIVVALYTVPDVLAGRSITGNGQASTFFGGAAGVKTKTSPTTTVTTSTPTTTATTTAPTTTKTTSRATSTSNTTTPTNTRSTVTPTTNTTPPAVKPTTTTQTKPAP